VSGIIFRPAEARSATDDSIVLGTIGIDGVNSPRVIRRPNGYPSILLLQLHTGGEMAKIVVERDTTIVWTPGQAQRYGIIGRPIWGRNLETAGQGGLRPGTRPQSRFGR
jgi:hypothetical protein